jgi:hypothetical protein
VAEDLLLGPVVELGGYEPPIADLGVPRQLVTDHIDGAGQPLQRRPVFWRSARKRELPTTC